MDVEVRDEVPSKIALALSKDMAWTMETNHGKL
jgi:hypothetical protein